MVGQGFSLLVQMINQGRVVRLDELVEQCLLGLMPFVGSYTKAFLALCQHGGSALDLRRTERTRLEHQLDECHVRSVQWNSCRRSDLPGILLCASPLALPPSRSAAGATGLDRAFEPPGPWPASADSRPRNRALVDRMVGEHDEDVIVADSLDELADRMQEKQLLGIDIDKEGMKSDVRAYDQTIARDEKYMWDLQLVRIAQYRKYRGDRMRLCRFQAIDDPGARPLIAVLSFIMARKSLGGIQTDLQCRVIQQDGQVIEGLFAVGEAAGFGGGGIHGLGSLEGTFLGGCVLTARAAARAIA